MNVGIGIVGLPNVGKSTLFNALTKAGVLAANYPFATIEPNTGVVPIPDPRLEVLSALFKSRRTVPATVTFVDIAGLVSGASEGEGLGNRFLGNIREVDAVCHVVRAFTSENVSHVSDDPHPAEDIGVIETELALADLQTIDKRLPRLEKEATVDKSIAARVAVLRSAREVVASGKPLNTERRLATDPALADLKLLTAKPVMYVYNCDEATLTDQRRRQELVELVRPSPAIFIDAQIEAELVGMESEDAKEILESVGQSEPGLSEVIRGASQVLGLQSFLTAGEKESRAWTIKAGSTAYDAAGVIHTDFQRGFIAAEVVAFDRLVEAGSWVAARQQGLARTEGRGYVMRPDDVVEFRFNV